MAMVVVRCAMCKRADAMRCGRGNSTLHYNGAMNIKRHTTKVRTTTKSVQVVQFGKCKASDDNTNTDEPIGVNRRRADPLCALPLPGSVCASCMQPSWIFVIYSILH